MNMASLTTEKLYQMVERISEGIAKMGGEPYDSHEISREKQRQIYESLTPEDMFQLIGRHGRPAVEKYVRNMEERKHA